MRGSMKLFALGAVVATALTATACEPKGADKSDDKSSPPASAPSKPGKTPGSGSTGKATPTPTKPSDGGSGGGGKYADRQVPPTGSICDHGGQGPYGAIESVNFGGDSPNTVVGLVLGSYECAQPGEASPVFTPSSATGAATDILLDDAHLKVVVGGRLASQLGTKTPSANKFVKKLAEMQDDGKLEGTKAPQFYFRSDVPSDDVNSMPDDTSHIVYLYQIVDGG
ncbi:hypothetical protein [Streptomyces beijiangensis]|nr:hypothetical protein [Streptomyces beijiangensis]